MTTVAVTTRTAALRLSLAALAAMAVNAVIALAAKALDTGGIGVGLSPVEYLPFSVLGVLAGAAGWILTSRYAPKALRVVVPAVLVLTWVPDVLQFNAGATAANVVGLMLMHLVVAVVVVAALRKTTLSATGKHQ
jgi:hypothetical protein